jgi:curli biogenesis system outer membrane secretion channel CsgG
MKSLILAFALLAFTPVFTPAVTLAADSAAAPAAAPAQDVKTVEGPIAKVVARKKEIYVQGADKKYEFYFTPKTEIVKDGKTAEFSVLTEGAKVRVSYGMKGKRLDPLKVEVLP